MQHIYYMKALHRVLLRMTWRAGKLFFYTTHVLFELDLGAGGENRFSRMTFAKVILEKRFLNPGELFLHFIICFLL